MMFCMKEVMLGYTEIMTAPVSTTTPARKRLSREESRAQTREHLLESAKVLFARKGFEATSVEDVAEHAGYSRGALYSNYSGKEELLTALIDQCFERDIAQIERVTDTVNDPKVRGQIILEQFVNLDLPLEALLLQQEFWMCALRYPLVREVQSRQLENLHASIARLVERQVQDMRLELPSSVNDLVVALTALRNGLIAQRYIHDDPRFLETYRRVFAHLIGVDLSL